MSQKGSKMDTEINPKLPKGTNGEPKGVRKGEEGRKKVMPKTKPKKHEKWMPKGLARRNARGHPKVPLWHFLALRGLS